MKTVFVGGSRHVTRLPDVVKARLDNMIGNRHRVVVGDANGADKALQKYFLDAAYDDVIVFCSGESYRNNLGRWQTHHVNPPESAKGFQFYAAKDREMASKAEFGLMIWDGKSPGTVLNVLRLVHAGKIAVLVNVADQSVTNFKSMDDWNGFLERCGSGLRSDLRERATPSEWSFAKAPLQPSMI